MKAIDRALAAATSATVVDYAWAKPIALEAAPLPPLSVQPLPGWAGNFADSLAAATETPRELPTFMALAAISACVQGNFVVQPAPDHIEPVNIWALAVLGPGNRKTSVVTACTAPIRAREKEREEAMKPDIEKAKTTRSIIEGRIKELQTKASKGEADDVASATAEIQTERSRMPEIPTPPRYWAADVTPEQLGVLMAQNGDRLAILSDEGGFFELAGGRYNGGVPNLDLLLQGHAGAPVRVDRKSGPPLHLERPALTMGLSPQPDVLRGLADKPGFRGRGFLARFIFVLPASTLGHRTLDAPPMPPDVKDAYSEGITALLDTCGSFDADGKPTPHVLTLSDQAKSEWKAFSREVEKHLGPGGQMEHITDWGSKLPGVAIRLAGLFHVVAGARDQTWKAPISSATMNSAIEFARLLVPHALMAFDLMGADPALDSARHILAWIMRKRPQYFSARDAFHDLKARFKFMTAITPALNVLVERGYIREPDDTEPKRPGRPSRLFEVNPHLYHS